MSFQDLGLSDQIIKALKYDEPTPIQAAAIPMILSGVDVMASAQTGTGKTAGFTLPMLERLSSRKKARNPRALVLVPTRELANQVSESVTTYSKHLPLRSTVVYGGVSIHYQTRVLRRGVDIIVATPGRLLDHVSQGNIDLSQIEIVVLDEADRMLDMGFIHDIKKIGEYLPEERQTLMFSATFSKPIEALANSLMHKPERIQVSRRNETAHQVSQIVHLVKREKKLPLLIELIHSESWPGILVFARTKMGAEKLANKLDRAGISAEAIHGDKSQRARMHALNRFKRGQVQVLVGTDVAARGLDIDKLECVVNFDMPEVAEDYVHRIGRTGRAGESGTACSLVSPGEMKKLSAVEKLIGKKIERAGAIEVTSRPPVQPKPRPQEEEEHDTIRFSANNPFAGSNLKKRSQSSVSFKTRKKGPSPRFQDDRPPKRRANDAQGHHRRNDDRFEERRGRQDRFGERRESFQGGRHDRFDDRRGPFQRGRQDRFTDDRAPARGFRQDRFDDDRGSAKPARFQEKRGPSKGNKKGRFEQHGKPSKPGARFKEDCSFEGRTPSKGGRNRFADDRPSRGHHKGKPSFNKPKSKSFGGQKRTPFHYGKKASSTNR